MRVTDEVRGPLRLAHRGDWRQAPENSLAAFRTALELPGCDGLEFDVRRSRDLVPVVIHDETLARVQGREGRVAELDAAELERYGVPTLEAVLAETGDAFLDVELKEDVGAAVVEVLAAARGPRLPNAAISSFEVAALRSVRALAPEWTCWLNADDLSQATVDLALELGCAGVSVEWHALGERPVERARSSGLTVAAWTVRRRWTFEKLASLGVIAVCVEDAALA